MPDATRQPALTAATRRRVKQRAQHPKRSCGARPLNTVRCNSAQHVETPERTRHRGMTPKLRTYMILYILKRNVCVDSKTRGVGSQSLLQNPSPDFKRTAD